MAFHDPKAAGELDAAGQGAAERPERLAVLALDEAEQDAVVAGALRLGGEAQAPDRVEARSEGDRLGLVGDAVDPDRALAAALRVVHAGDEVPRHRAPVGRAAGAGAPLPRGVAGVAAGGIVDEPRRLDRQLAPVDRDGAARGDRRLAGVDPRTAVRARHLDRRARGLEHEVDRDTGVAYPHRAIRQGDRPETHARALAQRAAVPDGPERLRHAGHADDA